MVTIVLLTVTTIASVVGVAVRNSFSQVASTVSSPSHPSAGGQVGSSRASTIKLASTVYSVPKMVWVWLGMVAAFILNGLFWFLILRRIRTERPAKQSDEPVKKVGMGDDEIFAKRQIILHTLSSDLDALFGDRIQVRHFMSDTVKAIAADVSAEEVAKMMAENKIRHLMVAKNHRVLGIISDRDFRRDGMTAADMMTVDPVTVDISTPMMMAITIFLKRRISCLPVVEDGKLCGILTTTDLMMGLQANLQLMCKYSDQFKSATA
jgi:CBS domain-containing protein